MADADLDRVHDPLMSPLVWDLGHIAAFEDLWVCRETGLEPLRPDLADVYDAAETPRRARSGTSYLRRPEALDYLEQVRERTLSEIERVPGLTAELIVQHEQQHNETMLQTLQLAQPGVFTPDRRQSAPRPRAGGALHVEAGPATIGQPAGGFAYDNERPRHEVWLDAFEIDRAPTTNGTFLEFVDDGGYRDPAHWSKRGWNLREEEGWERPLYWTDDGHVRRFDRVEPLDPELPVMHVSWYEADAFARWCGWRLPSEAEWERAAAPQAGDRGNLDQLDFAPGPAGPFLGDCWEWTASEFAAYPGFRPYPYREYSELFFDSGFMALRGASWATRPRVARETFRSWDLPRRRQIFAGFRCARDV